MYYARIMPVKGSGVDRRTPNYKNERTLAQGVARLVKGLTSPGPYMCAHYGPSGMLRTTMEG